MYPLIPYLFNFYDSKVRSSDIMEIRHHRTTTGPGGSSNACRDTPPLHGSGQYICMTFELFETF